MNWPWFKREHLLVPPAGRGRPGERLVRGFLWATLAIFVISVLLFWSIQCNIPEPIGF